MCVMAILQDPFIALLPLALLLASFLGMSIYGMQSKLFGAQTLTFLMHILRSLISSTSCIALCSKAILTRVDKDLRKGGGAKYVCMKSSEMF